MVQDAMESPNKNSITHCTKKLALRTSSVKESASWGCINQYSPHYEANLSVSTRIACPIDNMDRNSVLFIIRCTASQPSQSLLHKALVAYIKLCRLYKQQLQDRDKRSRPSIALNEVQLIKLTIVQSFCCLLADFFQHIDKDRTKRVTKIKVKRYQTKGGKILAWLKRVQNYKPSTELQALQNAHLMLVWYKDAIRQNLAASNH